MHSARQTVNKVLLSVQQGETIFRWDKETEAEGGLVPGAWGQFCCVLMLVPPSAAALLEGQQHAIAPWEGNCRPQNPTSKLNIAKRKEFL